MNDYVIEDDVPLPVPGSGRWAFVDRMTVGQSFVMQKKDYGALRAYAFRHSLKVMSRSVSKTKIRIWKLEDKNEQ